LLAILEPCLLPPRVNIRVIGEVDIASAPTLLRLARRSLDQECMSICMDLGEVTFMDSAGLAMLERAHAEALARGGHVQVTRQSVSVRRIANLVASSVLA